MISDNYFSATVVSNKNWAHFVKHLTLSFIRFHFQLRQQQLRRLLHSTFASTGHFPDPPSVRSRFTLHPTPHQCWCLTVCFYASLWGLGPFASNEHSHRVVPASSSGHDASELPSYQNPSRLSTLTERRTTGRWATTTSTFSNPPARRSS